MATCQSQHFPLFSACCRAQSTTIEISYKAAKPRAWKSLFCSFLNSRSKSSRKKEEKTSARRQMLMSCDVESWKIILFRSHVEGSSDDTQSTERDEIGKKKNAREEKKTVWKENWKNKKIFDKSASLFVRHEAEAICPDFFSFLSNEDGFILHWMANLSSSACQRLTSAQIDCLELNFAESVVFQSESSHSFLQVAGIELPIQSET